MKIVRHNYNREKRREPSASEIMHILGAQAKHVMGNVTRLTNTREVLETVEGREAAKTESRSLMIEREAWTRKPVPITSLTDSDVVVRSKLLISIKHWEE